MKQNKFGISERYEDASLSIPSSSLLKDKGKGDRSSRALSLSPWFLYVSRPLPPALCSSFERWRTKYSRNFSLETHSKQATPETGEAIAASRSEATHLSWFAVRAFPCVRGKSLRGAHQALCCGVPPLSTRVIDGWVSAWPRLVHFALHRVPPSQSQTTMRTNNIGQRNLVIVWEYNLYAVWLWLFFSYT